MKEPISARERMLLAMTNRQPDRVPVAPDISNMIPCRLTGKPFWEVYYFSEPPLWRAYIEAVKYFGFDGWFIDGSMQYAWPGERRELVENLCKTTERWVVERRGQIDGLSYRYETTYCWAPRLRLRKPPERPSKQPALVVVLSFPPETSAAGIRRMRTCSP